MREPNPTGHTGCQRINLTKNARLNQFKKIPRATLALGQVIPELKALRDV